MKDLTMPTRPHFLLAFALAGVFSCSAEDPVADDNAVVRVTVSSNQFSPAAVTIKAGRTVRWTWAGGTHNVVSGENCTPDGTFKSGEPQGGGTFEQKFETPGTFPYFCRPHCSMGMTGTVVVTE